MGRRDWIKALVSALVAGILSGAGVLPLIPFVGIVGFTLLLWALWSVRGRKAGSKGFAIGFVAGTTAHAFQLSWLAVVSPLGAVVLPLYLGLFWGTFGACAATLGNPGSANKPNLWTNLLFTFANAAVFAGLEWLRGWLFTGFGWNGLGVAYHQTLLIAQVADVFGVAGLSLLVVWIAGLLSLAVANRNFKLLGPVAVIGLAVCGYGVFRIQQEKGLATTPLRALLVQVNIPQDAAQYLWDPAEIHMAYENDTLAALADAKAQGKFPDWVVWPESALTGRIFRTDDGGWGTWEQNVETVNAIRGAGDFSLIYGANELEAVATEEGGLMRKPEGNAYNSLVVMSPEDELQTFRKHHLVIFGETIPFVDSIPFLKEIYKQQAGVEYGGSFTPGKSFDPLPVQAAGGTISVIPSVCFEDTVSRLTRRFLKPGPQVIVNVTNDGWFERSAAASQHFANATFRAIELRRPMIRCANTGVSAALNSTGSPANPETGKSQILTDASGSHFTRGSLLVDLKIPLDPPCTLYALIGDWGIIITGIIGFLSVLRLRKSV